MILHFNYEELRALRSGAQAFLGEEPREGSAVLAPPESRARVEALLPRLDGDLSLPTLGDLRAVAAGVEAIVDFLRVEMELAVVATHPADEAAVSAYFDFAHALTASRRLLDLAAEMEALIELVSGEPLTPESVADFRFPD